MQSTPADIYLMTQNGWKELANNGANNTIQMIDDKKSTISETNTYILNECNKLSAYCVDLNETEMSQKIQKRGTEKNALYVFLLDIMCLRSCTIYITLQFSACTKNLRIMAFASKIHHGMQGTDLSSVTKKEIEDRIAKFIETNRGKDDLAKRLLNMKFPEVSLHIHKLIMEGTYLIFI